MNSSVCLLQEDCGLPFVPFEEESKGWFWLVCKDDAPRHQGLPPYYKSRQSANQRNFPQCPAPASRPPCESCSSRIIPPPTAGPEFSFVRLNVSWLLRRGHEVRVLPTACTHTSQAIDTSLMAALPEDLKVTRVASPDAVLASKHPRFGKSLAVLLGRHVLPEVFLPWAQPATRAGRRLIETWQPDVIYSRAPKHVSNVVGWCLKRQTGLPWVPYFSDPWISGGLPYRRIQR